MDRASARNDGRALNEAVEPSLDVDQWQTQHIQEGIRQADAGEFASEAELAAAFSRWGIAGSIQVPARSLEVFVPRNPYGFTRIR